MGGKKLLQINGTANWGSTGRIAEQIGQAVSEQGWKSYIAYGRKAGESSSELIQVGSGKDYFWHGIQSRLFDRHALASVKATEELVGNIEKIKPDLIHLHNLHGYYLNIEILFRYLQKKKIPIVWTLHDCWAFTGHCAFFDAVACEKWKSLCEACPQKKEYPASLWKDRSSENYRLKKELFTSLPRLTLVTVSSWLEKTVKSSFLGNLPCRMIYNGVDTEQFSPVAGKEIREKFGIGDRFMMLGVANIWSARKGLEDFIRLSERLKQDEVIVLIGVNKRQRKELPAGIIGIGRTENLRQLAAFYSASDVVLNLSVEETFGLTTVEGMACGTPSVVYNATASPELVSEHTGFVIGKGDLAELQQCLAIIREKGKSFYTEACRKRALEGFSKENTYRAYMQLYEQLLGENNS